MQQIRGPVIVLDDGGVASLVAECLCEEPPRVTPFAAVGGGVAASSRVDAVKRRAELLGLAPPVTGHVPKPAAAKQDGAAPPHALDERAMTTDQLLRAGREAVGLGVRTLIWPVHCGIDLEAMERELARARLVERLVNLDAPRVGTETGGGSEPAVRLETPLLDLTDQQIAELARDLDAPLETAWWCLKDGPAPCGRCAGCRRWEAVLESPRSRSAGEAPSVA